MPEDRIPRRVLAIVPHQDDFEFTCGGAFALLRERYGDAVALKVVCVTDGSSGHHELDAAATAERRDGEARAAAAVVGAEYELLRPLEGAPIGDGRSLIDHRLLGGVWNAIRAFEPDLVFCPPVPADPLAGVHVDHLHTAQAVRLVAYQILVPRAYPTLEGPVKRRVRYPLIVNLDDGYNREGSYDLCQDISTVYPAKERMALCHESQVLEWLPWLQGHDQPITRDQAAAALRQRHSEMNARYGRDDAVPREYYRVTRWARSPEPGELDALFPARC